MNAAFIKTVIRTYSDNGKFRNNVVEMAIPREAAIIIAQAWNEEGELAQRNAIKAQFLASNQDADGYIMIDDVICGGTLNMQREENHEDERAKFEDIED